MYKRGFTLIELSIVLVIIGLIIGGVLVGRDLIKAAAIRATVSQIEKYNVAANAFLNKYNCLPGDCAIATNFWPAKADCSAGNGVASTTAEACNGDGNGIIDEGANWENIRFWQHLTNANLIEGTYRATDIDMGDFAHPDSTLPVAKMGKARFSIFSGFNSQIINFTEGYFLGGYPAEDYYSDDSVVHADQAFGIDSKIDDGKPDSGIVLRYTGFNGDPTECATGADGAYTVNSNTSVCSLAIKAQF